MNTLEMAGAAVPDCERSALMPALNERSRRLVAAAEAELLGHGGIAAVAKASGVSRATIGRGLKELRTGRKPTDPERIRKPGAGRKKVHETDDRLWADLESLVEPVTRGDPESPLRWTCKSLRLLASQLRGLGHSISYPTVGTLLRQAGYSLQANQKTKEGGRHPDRNAQFEHINRQVRRRQAAKQPVISVDTKKKELVGDFKAVGREWRPQGASGANCSPGTSDSAST